MRRTCKFLNLLEIFIIIINVTNQQFILKNKENYQIVAFKTNKTLQICGNKFSSCG